MLFANVKFIAFMALIIVTINFGFTFSCGANGHRIFKACIFEVIIKVTIEVSAGSDIRHSSTRYPDSYTESEVGRNIFPIPVVFIYLVFEIKSPGDL